MIERIPDLVNADANLVRRGRYLSTTFMLGIGDLGYLVKIIEGRVNSFFKDTVLLEQPSVVDPKKTVAQVLAESGTAVTGFARFEPGQA